MSGLEGLAQGLISAMQPELLMWAFIGCLLGNLIGVLPGLGSAGSIAILLPITFVLPPAPALIMLAAIFYGSNYGGTITTVLLNIPGEASSAITALDGHPMARQGRAGVALGIAAIGSFVGGMVATVGLALGAPLLASLGLMMGPTERFALMVFALSLVTGLLGTAMVRGLVMAFLGLLLGTVGVDPTVGVPRFTFGQTALLDGLDFVAVVMGVFGISEILINSEKLIKGRIAEKIGRIWPSLEDIRQSVGAITRGTGIGFVLGMIPGATGVVASFLSYSVESSVSKDRSRFGKGAIEGVAGPETANNAFGNANFIPLFALGIPGTASLAILMGGMMLYGLVPGPFLFRDSPDLVWTIIASMFVGNVIMLILNVPLISIWIQILRVPYALLAPIIAVLTLVGSYTITNSMVSVITTIAFGIVGYVAKKLSMPLAPFVLTLIIGPILESNLRRSLQISQGDPAILIGSPISIVLLGGAVLVIALALLRLLRKDGQALPDED